MTIKQNKEKDRIFAHEQCIEAMLRTANFEAFAEPDAEDLQYGINTLNMLHKVAMDNTPYDWEEFASKAAEVHKTTLNTLTVRLEAKKKADAGNQRREND